MALVKLLLPDRYRIDCKLGEGGMGTVYKARDLSLQIDVAVKVLRSRQAPEQALARFQQEAKTASRLKHPGIVTILDFGVVDGEMPYMVLEYVEGCSLETLLQKRGPLCLEEALPLFIATAEALAHAHGEGVLHRDLKPDNVMVVGQNQIKLLDFGIAKFAESEGMAAVTSTGALLGSPLYMSPEQARARGGQEAVDCRSDIYSLGVLMFKSMSGRVPIQADSVIETISLKTEQPAPLLSTTGAPSNEELDRILARCLAIDPESRYTSVEELLKDLTSLYVLEEFPFDLSEASTDNAEDVKSMSGTRFESRALLYPGAFCVAALLVLGGFLFFQLQRPVSSPPSAEVADTSGLESADFLIDEGGGRWTVSQGADPKTFAILAEKPLLKEVSIKQSEITRAMLAPLKRTSIEQITLEDVGNLSPLTLKEIASISSLERLRFVDCFGIDRPGLEALSGMPELRRLFLEYCQKVDDQCVPLFSRFPRLNRLSLRMSQVSPSGLRMLPKDRIFHELDLAQLGLVDADLFCLEKLNLRSVNLSGNKLTSDGIRSLLSRCGTVTELTLKAVDIAVSERLQISTEFPEVVFHFDGEHYHRGARLK